MLTSERERERVIETRREDVNREFEGLEGGGIAVTESTYVYTLTVAIIMLPIIYYLYDASIYMHLS